MWEESSTLPTLDTKQDLMRECFPLLFSFSHHRHSKQKRFSIKMCQALPAQMGKEIRTSTSIPTDSHIHIFYHWCDPFHYLDLVDHCSNSAHLSANLSFPRLASFAGINHHFRPRKKSYLKYAPFYSFLVSLWAPLDPILVSCTIVMAPTSWPSIFHLSPCGSWPSMLHLLPFLSSFMAQFFVSTMNAFSPFGEGVAHESS